MAHDQKGRPTPADRQTDRVARQDPGAGVDGIALDPPSYGIEFLDRPAAAPAQRQAKPEEEEEPLQRKFDAQGDDIHLAPGQEKHLPHEAWHVVQQRQGRVKPALQARGVAPASAVFQRQTKPPSGVVVYLKNGTVVKVESQDDGAKLEFDLALAPAGETFAEGVVVLTLSAGRVTSARFATVNTGASKLNDLAKIRKIDVREVKEEVKASTEVKAEAKEKARTLRLSVKSGEGESIITEKFTGFEKSSGEDQGQIHFEKHGAEFNAASKADYIRMAKQFGEAGGRQSMEAIVGNTIVKVDPPGRAIRRVLIANARQIRTFYVWNRDFSSDPFAYAIYYTITHNLKMPLSAVSPENLELLAESGVDLFAMEIEVVTKLLEEGKLKESVAAETLAPMAVIDKVISKDWKLELYQGLYGSKDPPDMDEAAAAQALKSIQAELTAPPRLEIKSTEVKAQAVDLGEVLAFIREAADVKADADVVLPWLTFIELDRDQPAEVRLTAGRYLARLEGTGAP